MCFIASAERQLTSKLYNIEPRAAPSFEAIPLVLLAAHGKTIFDSALFLYVCAFPHDGMKWLVLLLCLPTEPPVWLLAVRGGRGIVLHCVRRMGEFHSSWCTRA